MKSILKITASNRTKLKALPTTSARIRFLDKQGFSRSEIAVELDKRYQHVRNVLITPIKKERS